MTFYFYFIFLFGFRSLHFVKLEYSFFFFILFSMSIYDGILLESLSILIIISLKIDSVLILPVLAIKSEHQWNYVGKFNEIITHTYQPAMPNMCKHKSDLGLSLSVFVINLCAQHTTLNLEIYNMTFCCCHFCSLCRRKK